METLAAVLVETNKPLELMMLSLPSLKKGQVLVEIAYSGLCQTQLNEVKGKKGPDRFLPHTLGHEGSGIVREVGEGVTKVKVGDHVVVSWIKGIGHDVPGCAYDYRGKTVNSGAISTFLQHAVISENRVIPIPKSMPLRAAALFGCAVPTGAGVVFNEMKVKAKNSIVIFGLGGIGLSALIAAKYLQADPIIVVDLYDHKLEHARKLGATHAINARNQDPLAAISEIVFHKGVDFAFESAGVKQVMETAFSALKAPGGLCVLAGNLPQGQFIQIDPFELIKGKKIVGTWGGSSKIDEDVQRYADLHIEGSLKYDPLITHEIKLENINELLHALELGEVGRGIISFHESLRL